MGFGRRGYILVLVKLKKLIYLRTPICTFDAKNRILCPQCESKLDSCKRTPRFSIDIDKVILIAKNLRGIELAVEFEVKR